MLGTIGLFPLQLSSPTSLNTTSCHAFPHFWAQQTTSLTSRQNMELTCAFFYSNRIYHASKDTPVFSAFLDASKAFDRTNHNLLFAKLMKRNVPMCIVRLLLSWYRQQTMQVKWGTNHSSPFTVTNGVRQGGVLSPYFFAVCLDEISIQLGSARVGCTVRNTVVNHLMFADDICVFSPSISGLQSLPNIYGDYAAEHEITFNCIKTIGVLFYPKKYNQMFF